MATTASESVSDEELAGVVARREQAGSSMTSAASALERLYQRHELPLKSFLMARVGRADAEDLSQLVWLRVWKSLPGAKPGPFRAWLFEIARNALVDHARKKRPGSLADDQAGGIVDGALGKPEARLVEHERKTALENCLARLKQEYAVVVRGRLSGEEYDSISKAQGIRPERAHSIYHKAVKLLKSCVERVLP